jgi:hypothetical protein
LKRFWSESELLVAFNEALSVFNLATAYFHTRITLPTVAGQYDYVLSASMLYRTRMTYNSLPMSPSNREDLNHGRYQWRSDTTLTGRPVPDRPMLWVPIDLYLFYIWPADAAGGGTLTVDGVAATPVLVEDGDTVDLGEELLTTLLGYSVHVLSFKKGGPAFQATMPLFQTFLAEAAEMNDQIKTSQIYRRVMGLDDRGFKPLRGTPTRLDQLVKASP